jgi:protease I
MLVETGEVRGRTITSWPSLKTDIRNAGGTWVDEEVVVSKGVVTSRNPDDIPAFNREMIALFSKAVTGLGKPSPKVA